MIDKDNENKFYLPKKTKDYRLKPQRCVSTERKNKIHKESASEACCT